MTEPIRVFVSYSGTDWENSVKPMATYLLSKGIDPKVADWDLRPGDSLVRWILEEQLSVVSIVVIVLSRSSITRPWVKEELDHATIRRIEDKIRIIPFKIDDCQVPAPLRTLKYISVHSPSEWDQKLEELVDTIYLKTNKPPIGMPPHYMSRPPMHFPGISPQETHLLNFVLEKALETGGTRIGTSYVEENMATILSPIQIQKAISRLDARGIISSIRNINGRFIESTLLQPIREEYCASVYPGFKALQREIGADAARLNPNSYLTQFPPDGVPLFVYQTAVQGLANRQWFTARLLGNGGFMITAPSPFIDEWLEQL